ncbi:MAG: hypothetical protein MUQ10_12295, partial [Anaerolineae bacterium]|nr:hypothetical protein [Anaerolineae bacterium]
TKLRVCTGGFGGMTMPSFPQMSLPRYVGASHVLGEYPAEPDLFGTDEMWANSGREMHLGSFVLQSIGDSDRIQCASRRECLG